MGYNRAALRYGTSIHLQGRINSPAYATSQKQSSDKTENSYLYMLTYINRISMVRTPWVVLALTALSLELTALYFQYLMLLEPCVLCVYERTAVMGIMLAGLLGALAPSLAIVRWFGLVLWGASAGWGLQLAMKHTGIQLFPSADNSCDFLANYPSWFQLDAWFPAMFEPTGFCDEIQWQFFGYTMPQTMIAVYVLYLAALLVVVISQIKGAKNQF